MEAVLHIGTSESPCSPQMTAWTLLMATSHSPAISQRRRDESSTVPEPMTCPSGRPEIFSAACVMTSTGLVTSIRTASGDCSTIPGTIFFISSTVLPARSMRVSPGCCFAPAVITTMSEPAVTATSDEPVIFTGGMNDAPCTRSSASALTFFSLMSCSATSEARPLINVAYAREVPTAPAPTMESFVPLRFLPMLARLSIDEPILLASLREPRHAARRWD